MSSAAQTSFVGALCWNVPELLPVMQEHLDTYDTLLPHVLMGDITRWVVREFGADPSGKRLSDLFRFMEESFSEGCYEVQEIINVSFLENLPKRREEGFMVRRILGSNLQRELGFVGEE